MEWLLPANGTQMPKCADGTYAQGFPIGCALGGIDRVAYLADDVGEAARCADLISAHRR